MKKVLVGLILLAALFAFAAEAKFTLAATVTFTGTVDFKLTIDKDGVDMLGQITDAKVSVPFTPTSSTQAGATFDINYTLGTTGFGGNFTLKSITFKTPFFDAYYQPNPMDIDAYLAGADSDGNPYTTGDVLKLTFPKLISGFEFFYLDLRDPRTGAPATTWFEDMLIAKYSIAGINLAAGMYNNGNPDTYEFGVAAYASPSLGFATPTIRAFAGMVQVGADLALAYDAYAKASIQPIPSLTIEPEFQYSQNIAQLDYESISDGQYVQAKLSYSDTFGPVTPKLVLTPKYDIAGAALTVALNEASVGFKIDMFSGSVKVTNKDLLKPDSFTLYTEANVAVAPLTLNAKAYWDDITNFDKYKYINARATAVLDVLEKKDLTLTADYAMISKDNKSGYRLSAKFNLTAAGDTYIDGFYGNIDASKGGDKGLYDDPADFVTDSWRVRLVYTKKF